MTASGLVPRNACIQCGFYFNAAAQMTTHVGADPDIHLGRRSQLKMGIEAGHGMNLAQRDVNLPRQSPQLVCRQIAEFVLNDSEFVEQGVSVPLTLHHNVLPSPAIVTAKVRSGMPEGSSV